MADINATFQNDPEVARILKNKSIEIIERRKNGRIKQIIVAKLNHFDGKNALSETVANKAVQLLEKGNLALRDNSKILNKVNNDLKGLNGNIANIDEGVKNINANVQSVFKSINGITNLGFLNAGLSIVNIAVDVAGFAILSKKMNELENTVISVSNRLDKKVDQLKNIKKGEIKEEYNRINMQFLSLSRKIQDKDKYENDDIIQLINTLNPYIKKLLDFYYTGAIEKEGILTMLLVLSTLYSKLINLYMTNYYFEKGKILQDLPIYEEIYNMFVSPTFQQCTFDYFFLEKQMHNLEARDATNAFISLILQDVISISDQIEILSSLQSKDNYDAFETELSLEAEKQASSLLAQAQL